MYIQPHLSFPVGTERIGQDLSLDASHPRPSRVCLSSAQSQRMRHCEQLTAMVNKTPNKYISQLLCMQVIKKIQINKLKKK